jgi:hypothetical protein
VPGALLDAGGLILDVGATAVPGVPGGVSSVIKARRLAANAKFGRAFEKAVLNALDLSKNTKKVESITGIKQYRIPDAFANGILLEIKGVKKLDFTSQVKDLLSAAKKDQRKLVFAVTRDTKISKTLEALVESGDVFIIYFAAK